MPIDRDELMDACMAFLNGQPSEVVVNENTYTIEAHGEVIEFARRGAKITFTVNVKAPQSE